METNKPFIEMRDINKVYQMGDVEFNALKDINLSIENKEFVAIVGPSGSGKSTLMNLIGCLDVPTTGKYYINGNDVSSLDDDSLAEIRNFTIGFIFQGFNLLPKLNALENVELPLVYQGKQKEDRYQRSIRALERVGLSERLQHKPSQLSGGQQQRVAIARALVKNPLLLLCDEPTGALDYSTGKLVLKLLHDINKSMNKTIVVITHNVAISAMADRVIRVKSGAVESVTVNNNPELPERIEW
jgi:putative ABC transport system ATP-binding protein